MYRRFPSAAMVYIGLPEYESESSRDAAKLGALRGMYEIAAREFDVLRSLATAALTGNPDSIKALQHYLDVQKGIADMYAQELLNYLDLQKSIADVYAQEILKSGG